MVDKAVFGAMLESSPFVVKQSLGHTSIHYLTHDSIDWRNCQRYLTRVLRSYTYWNTARVLGRIAAWNTAS